MASILKVDEMQGVTSAGDITITSEGGSAAQSLQQGLAKVWINHKQGGGSSTRDSLNIGSVTDNGNGDYTLSFSSAMSNSDFVCQSTSSGDHNNYGYLVAVGPTVSSVDNEFTATTSSFRAGTGFASATNSSKSSADAHQIFNSVHGDLA